jgi:hypothetical protein
VISASYDRSPTPHVSGVLSAGINPLPLISRPPFAKRTRVISSGAGSWNDHWTPKRSFEKSSDRANPFGPALPPRGFLIGFERSPPLARNQPSAVHSIGSSRVWRPSVR